MNRQHQETALAYLRCFCRGDLESMAPLLTEDLRFRGPFLSTDNRADYLATLRTDPPQGSKFELIQSFAADGEAALFFQFIKPGVSAPMALHCRFRKDRIAEMRLIFNSRDFG